MEEIFLTAVEQDNAIHMPAASAVTVFLLKYCNTKSFAVNLVNSGSCTSEYQIRLPLDEFSDAARLQSRECPASVQQCVLPAVTCNNGEKVISGLCGVLRHIIIVSSNGSKIPDLIKLLSHKQICLKACAEVSSWTKFCEVEMINLVDQTLARNRAQSETITIPIELIKLENQFKQPCVVANASKRLTNARKNLRKIQNDMGVSEPLESPEELQHDYVEGLDVTLADLVLLPCVTLILNHWKVPLSATDDKLPLMLKWMQRLCLLSEVQQAFMSIHLPNYVLPENNSVENKTSTSLHWPTGEAENFSIREVKKKKFKSNLTDLDNALLKLCNHHFEFCSSQPCSDVQLPWEQFPEAAHPRDGDLPGDRLERKCQQLENLAHAVISMAKTEDVIVDFCSGGGHLGILLAYLLPDCKVLLVENKEESIQRAETRIQKLQLTNVIIYQCNLDYFIGKFDIGICLHACGVATDLVLQCCLENRASFVICPCCYGNIQNTHTMKYPRSMAFNQTELSYKEYLCLGHGADQTQTNSPMAEQGKLCMTYIDSDRASVAKEYGYDVTLTTLQPPECSPKNNLLIGKLVS